MDSGRCIRAKPSRHRLTAPYKKQAGVRRPSRIGSLSRQKRCQPIPHRIRQNGSICIPDSTLSILYVASFPGKSENVLNRNSEMFKGRCQRALDKQG